MASGWLAVRSLPSGGRPLSPFSVDGVLSLYQAAYQGTPGGRTATAAETSRLHRRGPDGYDEAAICSALDVCSLRTSAEFYARFVSSVWTQEATHGRAPRSRQIAGERDYTGSQASARVPKWVERIYCEAPPCTARHGRDETRRHFRRRRQDAGHCSFATGTKSAAFQQKNTGQNTSYFLRLSPTLSPAGDWASPAPTPAPRSHDDLDCDLLAVAT
jgi:hypothetical protein